MRAIGSLKNNSGGFAAILPTQTRLCPLGSLKIIYRKPTMTAPMYTLLLLTLLIANFPFLTQRGLGIIPLKRKTILHHLAELALGFIIIAAISYVLESRSGSVHRQDWEFYATVVCLYLVAAFPAFVWRYFWQGRNRE